MGRVERIKLKVVYEGWMAHCGQRKIGGSFIRLRYFVLKGRVLAYHKRQPEYDMVPIKTLIIDGNCRVEDRGLVHYSGLMVYELCVYKKKDKYHQITMAAFTIRELLIWKEKIESVIYQQDLNIANGSVVHPSFSAKAGADRDASSSDRERLATAEDEEENNRSLIRRTTIGNGAPESVLDWAREGDSELSNQSLRILEGLSEADYLQDLNIANGSMIHPSFLAKAGADRDASSSDRERLASAEDEEENNRSLIRRTTIGNGAPESVLDWAREGDSELSNQSTSDHVFSRKHWCLFRCENGLRILEEISEADYLLPSCRAMKAVGVVKATCEEIFELVMCMDGTRFEWDSSFQYGSLVEEIDGHTTILYHRLQLGWFSTLVWPRDLCYVRYWRRNDDGSYVVLFRSREHPNCGAKSGFVRAHIESGGFKISPLKSRNGRTRTQVQYLLQIDLKGWAVGYFPSFQKHCLLKMLNCVAALREFFSQTDDTQTVPRIPVIMSIPSGSISSKKGRKGQDNSNQSLPLHQLHSASGHSMLLDEESEDEDYQSPEPEEEFFDTFSDVMDSVKAENAMKQADEDPLDKLDLSSFSGNLRRDDCDNSRYCWRIPDGNNFKVRSKNFGYNKTKIPAGKPLMQLVAVDWFKDVKRIDHVARRQGCAVQIASEKGLFTLVINAQVPGSSHYSMVFYFVSKPLVPGSLLQHFVDGDDEFRNSRLKLIPSVLKGSWIVRQSVGSTPCLLAKAVDCTYIRGQKYLEIDIDIGSSTVANGVLGLVFGVITTLVVDMAFLIQANTYEELPERLIGAVRVSHLELSSAKVPLLDTNTTEISD